MKRRIFGLMLAAAMGLSLVACGKTDVPEDLPDDEVTLEQQEEVLPEEDKTDADPLLLEINSKIDERIQADYARYKTPLTPFTWDEGPITIMDNENSHVEFSNLELIHEPGAPRWVDGAFDYDGLNRIQFFISAENKSDGDLSIHLCDLFINGIPSSFYVNSFFLQPHETEEINRTIQITPLDLNDIKEVKEIRFRVVSTNDDDKVCESDPIVIHTNLYDGETYEYEYPKCSSDMVIDDNDLFKATLEDVYYIGDHSMEDFTAKLCIENKTNKYMNIDHESILNHGAYNTASFIDCIPPKKSVYAYITNSNFDENLYGYDFEEVENDERLRCINGFKIELSAGSFFGHEDYDQHQKYFIVDPDGNVKMCEHVSLDQLAFGQDLWVVDYIYEHNEPYKSQEKPKDEWTLSNILVKDGEVIKLTED